MDGVARGLVDDQHQPVAIDEASDYLFRGHAGTAITDDIMNDSTS
jgi:hypothetical protein